MDLFSFIDCANRTQSLSDLFDLLVGSAADQGFGEVAYGALNYEETVRLPEHPMPAIALNFPLDWRKHYFERKYYNIDPVVRRTASHTRPFMWDQLLKQKRLQAGERLVINESREAGLKHGVSVPLFGPSGRIAVLSFASRFNDADPVRQIRHLHALACQFHVAFGELSRPALDNRAITLSQRERECLRWTAEGKTSWDIGIILKISENTINFHIKKVMRKLDTTSRTVAVVKAIRLGLIEIPGLSNSSLPAETDVADQS
ncbi:LuxR family transcriptional regulator [Bradyrhizobium sp. 83002]|uniref:helix-turn-helix transcriptional regulator n=1 Tax=Bradyrhizobium aeschynomenes TaxID=2734909 RepID=UPI0015578EA7|nr:LuxR family transcriptional regulator [Bradyrhizobium aeschynomenes]NPU13408.1 LuxR family transcriptional regulator [Bradyrhizobium aeschynomenes]